MYILEGTEFKSKHCLGQQRVFVSVCVFLLPISVIGEKEGGFHSILVFLFMIDVEVDSCNGCVVNTCRMGLCSPLLLFV